MNFSEIDGCPDELRERLFESLNRLEHIHRVFEDITDYEKSGATETIDQLTDELPGIERQIDWLSIKLIVSQSNSVNQALGRAVAALNSPLFDAVGKNHVVAREDLPRNYRSVLIALMDNLAKVQGMELPEYAFGTE